MVEARERHVVRDERSEPVVALDGLEARDPERNAAEAEGRDHDPREAVRDAGAHEDDEHDRGRAEQRRADAEGGIGRV